jgi:hypothetical protein
MLRRRFTPERARLAMRVPRWNTSMVASVARTQLADHARRHRVEVARDFDVIIRRDAGTTPLGVWPTITSSAKRASQGGQFRSASLLRLLLLDLLPWLPC